MRMLIGVLKVSVPLSIAEVEMLKHIIPHNWETLCDCSNKVLQMLKHILRADFRNVFSLKLDHRRPGRVHQRLGSWKALHEGWVSLILLQNIDKKIANGRHENISRSLTQSTFEISNAANDKLKQFILHSGKSDLSWQPRLPNRSARCRISPVYKVQDRLCTEKFKCETLLILFKRRKGSNPPWLQQPGGLRMMKCALIKRFWVTYQLFWLSVMWLSFKKRVWTLNYSWNMQSGASVRDFKGDVANDK